MRQLVSRYWGVYTRFLSTCFAAASTYRLHFVLLIIMDQLFYFSMLGSVDFLYNHVSKIGAWHRSEFMFFIAFILAVDHLHMSFVSESFWEFAFDIRTGRLDFVLLRPLNTLFSVFARQIRPATLINFVTPWGFLIYYGRQMQLDLGSWILLFPMVLFSLVLLTSIEILVSMLMFWTVEAMGINFLRIQIQSVSRWPEFIYRGFANRLFTVVFPILLVGSAPVYVLLDHGRWPWALAAFVALVVIWALIGVFWQKGLKAYESASS
ncbi:MAG: hypothetical protein FJ146_18475 [Deltaproteobacteria bacterium]|nr:hypothetical protein [Deltaproteobacteria bacterium]